MRDGRGWRWRTWSGGSGRTSDTIHAPPPRHEPRMIGRWAALGRELRTPLGFVYALFRRFGWHHMPTLAAGLAFYFLLAFFPFLLFLVSIVTLVPGVEGLTDWLLQSAAAFLPPDAWTLAEGVIRGLLGQPRGGLVSLGVALALWSASSGFTSL